MNVTLLQATNNMLLKLFLVPPVKARQAVGRMYIYMQKQIAYKQKQIPYKQKQIPMQQEQISPGIVAV